VRVHPEPPGEEPRGEGGDTRESRLDPPRERRERCEERDDEDQPLRLRRDRGRGEQRREGERARIALLEPEQGEQARAREEGRKRDVRLRVRELRRERGREGDHREDRPGDDAARPARDEVQERRGERNEEEPRLQVEQPGLDSREAEAARLDSREQERVVAVQQVGLREPAWVEPVQPDERARLRRPERPRVVGPERLEPEVDRDRDEQSAGGAGEHELEPRGRPGPGGQRASRTRNQAERREAGAHSDDLPELQRSAEDVQELRRDPVGRGPGEIREPERARRRRPGQHPRDAHAGAEQGGVEGEEQERVGDHRRTRATKTAG
jgi:hypothetical protein